MGCAGLGEFVCPQRKYARKAGWMGVSGLVGGSVGRLGLAGGWLGGWAGVGVGVGRCG